MFEIKPRNLTVFLNSVKVVNFTCATEVSLTTFLRVYNNGMELNPLELGDVSYDSATTTNEQGDLINVYVVSLVVKVAYNESVIHCRTRQNDGETETADGFFLIQGILKLYVI